MRKSCHDCWYDRALQSGCPIHSDKPESCKYFNDQLLKQIHHVILEAIAGKEIFHEFLNQLSSAERKTYKNSERIVGDYEKYLKWRKHAKELKDGKRKLKYIANASN